MVTTQHTVLQTSTGRTPLIEAVRNNRPAVVKALLALGASADYVNGRGQVTAMFNSLKFSVPPAFVQCVLLRALLTSVTFRQLVYEVLSC
jgi:ankyrin repeat protein